MAEPGARRVAIFPGAWNPPTIAHVSIARAALSWADEVVWLLPERFPHKSFEGAPAADRQLMLRILAETEPRFSAAVSETNLHIEMARETLQTYGSGVEVGIICGRDAVERIATWDYGRPGVFEEMLAEHPLLVAARQGDYQPPPSLASRIQALHPQGNFDEVSSSEVRRMIASGDNWQRFVPRILVPHVARAFGATLYTGDLSFQ